MKKRNSAGRLLAILLVALLVPAMAACSAKDGDQQTEQTEQSETGSVTSDEPQNEEEALALYRELMDQENKILSENTDLWEKVYLEADKGMAMLEDGKNYGEFLLKTIEAAKDQFTEEELKTLQSEAEKISELESRLTMLEEKYPEVAQKYLDSAMNMEADSNDPDGGMSMPADRMAGKIFRGIRKKKRRMIFGFDAKILNFFYRLMPKTTTRLVAVVLKKSKIKLFDEIFK